VIASNMQHHKTSFFSALPTPGEFGDTLAPPTSYAKSRAAIGAGDGGGDAARRVKWRRLVVRLSILAHV